MWAICYRREATELGFCLALLRCHMAIPRYLCIFVGIFYLYPRNPLYYRFYLL